MSPDDPPPSSWDLRYETTEYRYGTAPNDFLRAQTGHLKPESRILCLAEGEGRNAVHLAELGHRPVGVDASEVGLAKARELALKRDVVVETVVADLSELRIEPDGWDAVVSIWCHVPPELRVDLHRRVVQGLRPGGVLILEAYTPAQIDRGTGGPPHPERLMTLEALKADLDGLDFVVAQELEREVLEGDLHTGLSHVVQVVAVRPG